MDWCSSVAYPHTGGSCALPLYGPMLLRDSLSSQTDSLLTNYARQYTCDMLETNEVKPSDNVIHVSNLLVVQITFTFMSLRFQVDVSFPQDGM